MRMNSLTNRFGTYVTVLTMTVIIGLVVATVSGASYYYSLKKTDSLPQNDLSHKIWWRARLFARKATGGVPELEWGELWWMTHQKGGFGLEALAVGVSANG